MPCRPLFPLRNIDFPARVAPGIGLCLAIGALAIGLERAQAALFGKSWLEALNLALLLGVGVRAIWRPRPACLPGISFCARTLLNIAIVLLGAAFSVGAVRAIGPGLVAGAVGIVAFGLVFTCCVGWLAGLPARQTLLVACGNSICGNSAIMAAAPIIEADDDDVGASIAFTAAGGLVVVLGLPLVVPLLGLPKGAEGALAGLTVYAVPQVVAAAAPFGVAAVHVGTLVKLVRVLMLGPVCVVLALIASAWRAREAAQGACLPPVTRLVPWYIIGFVAMMAVRSAGGIPAWLVMPLNYWATFLTILAMAALGLGVELRAVLRAGRALMVTVSISLIGLLGASMALVRVMLGG
ncbi:YeiH family protein [Komagataeibacter xylinus]|uniref:Putative sulfate exporter family transporter n=1 Tax=Komagataeibacter xylinus TaxID=28448 RepID=A0A857FN01_KOMXY|nr:putative sulfate exporter family transporter [Komagataeibacter xylinus]QHC35641.1 putative sulfate exporter family transporter [Komagataeibacter xylinus]